MDRTTPKTEAEREQRREQRYQAAKNLAYAMAALELAQIHLDRCAELAAARRA